MIKTGAILFTNFNNAVFPPEWQASDWHELLRSGKPYKVITSFEQYWTEAVSSQFAFVGTSEEYEVWLETDPLKIVLEDKAFGQEILNDYLVQNKQIQLTTMQSLSQLTKFSGAKQLLEAGAISSVLAVISAIDVDEIFTQERKNYFINKITDYLA